MTEILDDVMSLVQEMIKEEPDLESYTITVVYDLDGASPLGEKKKSFKVRFTQNAGRLIFEEITIIEK